MANGMPEAAVLGNGGCIPLRGEDTKRNLKHVKEPLGGAISLNNVQDGVLAQPEPMAYFPVRLTFADEL
jgi:hypothetical protein